jgi:hypothetical protein
METQLSDGESGQGGSRTVGEGWLTVVVWIQCFEFSLRGGEGMKCCQKMKKRQ